MVDPADTALLLIDHQSGLFQTVKDIEIHQLGANVVALARTAKLLSLPVITTASVRGDQMGPLMPETAQTLPKAQFVPRMAR